MERIQADGGVGAVLLNRAQDPLGAIAADVGELGAALLAEKLSTTFLLRPSVAQTSRPVT
jgi:hypothetical protein